MIVIFSFVLSNQYKYSHIQENELTTVSEVFDYSAKEKNHYTIYCESGNKYNISYISADDEHIDCLKAGDVLSLGLDHKQVLKLEANGLTIISIEDCNYRYAKQFKVSVIVCPIMIMVVVLIHIGLNFWLKKIENNYKCNYNNSIVKTNEIIDKKLDRTTRYYISKTGGVLIKKFDEDRTSGVNVGYSVTLFNKYVEKDMKDYNINYNFYIAETYKIINAVDDGQLSLF